MNILSLLECLSNKTHFCLEMKNLLKEQPEFVKEIFLTNDIDALKSLLGNTNNLADRDEVVHQINERILC